MRHFKKWKRDHRELGLASLERLQFWLIMTSNEDLKNWLTIRSKLKYAMLQHIDHFEMVHLLHDLWVIRKPAYTNLACSTFMDSFSQISQRIEWTGWFGEITMEVTHAHLPEPRMIFGGASATGFLLQDLLVTTMLFVRDLAYMSSREVQGQLMGRGEGEEKTEADSIPFI